MEQSDAWTLTDNLQLPRGQSDPFSAAIRSNRMPIIVTDLNLPDNPIIFANDSFLKLTGYERDEVNGRNCRFLQGPDTDPETVRTIRRAIEARTDVTVDILNYRKDGTTFWNALYLSPVPDAQGNVRYFFASQLDATDRKKYEFAIADQQLKLEQQVKARTSELESLLRHNTVLLHEVDHRVKNNLQMISAMLMLQSMAISDPNIKNTLQEMLERVDAMGLVHKRLYQSDNISEFDIAEFTREIAGHLVGATGRSDIALTVEATTVKIKADDAASVALVVNEAITNALKHAFPVGRGGDLLVGVKPSTSACEISIQDDGPGMAATATAKGSFGMTLIDTLVNQLRAKIEWLPVHPGTQVKITLPLT